MNTVSVIVYLLAFVGMAIWLAYALKYKRWALTIGPFTYFTSIIVLYTSLCFDLLTPLEINMWSNVIRLESIFLFIIMGAVLWKRGNRLWI